MVISTAARIRSVLAEHLGVASTSLTEQARLTKDLGADAIDILTLVMTVEEALDIEITDEAIEALATVSDLIGLAERLIEEKAA